MKTNVTDSSRQAFGALNISKCEWMLLSVLWPGATYTDKQAARMCYEDASWVSARRNALKKIGVIEDCGLVRCPVTNRMVNGWCVGPQMAELI